MDNVVLALSVAIAVVLVLLVSCWGGKAHSQQRGQAPVRQQRRVRQSAPMPKSQYGSGVKNQQASYRYNDLSDLSGADDYNAVAQYMAVEPEVYESHARYSSDMGRSTAGASMLAERDDPNDVVPWVGLRKPKYKEAYSNEGARQESSDSPDQMRDSTFYVIG